MKKTGIVTMLLIASFCLSAKELNVLMIGNSFSGSVGICLPGMVKSVPGCKLKLTNAFIGACSLERHSKNLKAAEKNPKADQYRINVWTSDGKTIPARRGTVLELLKTQKYDIITIQQNSANSLDYKTFQPHANYIISIIKKYQPQAEIIIHQTWSYRADSSMLKNRWKISNDEMYNRLSAAYSSFAKETGFRVIPVGDAVQIFRKNSPVKFKEYDPASLANYSWPDKPSQAGEVVGSINWRRDKGVLKLFADTTHFNSRGEYLQAAVWFAILFDKKTSEIKYVPGNIGDDDAAFLRKCAQEAVDGYIQR